MSGCRGDSLHQHIINLVAYVEWEGFYVLVDDWVMMTYLQTNKRPDFILVDKKNPSMFLIGEVGRYNPDKWPTNYPVIHLGKGGRISLINAGQEWVVVKREFYSLISTNTEIGTKAISGIFKKEFSDSRVNKALELLLGGKRLNEIADMGILPNNDHSRKADNQNLTREGLKHVLSMAFKGCN
jgi:hypothetical protein